MNTVSKRNIAQRKTDHIRICTDESRYTVEYGTTEFEAVQLIHNALPELNADAVSTATEFCGYRLALPLMISPMTGGSSEGEALNYQAAEVAEECKIAMGLGSMRILFRHPELSNHFAIKKIAPNVPIIANIGAVQLRENPIAAVQKLCDDLKVDLLSIHLNCGQELFQIDGDRDFNGLCRAIRNTKRQLTIPVIVKETGCGIAPREIEMLFDCGIDYVDIAGGGGTSWIAVETLRTEQAQHALPTPTLFNDWGIPTAAILAALQLRKKKSQRRIIASGGVRNSSHIAKALALGASLTAMALPFARIIARAGVAEAIAFVEQLKVDLAVIMALTGAQSIRALQQQQPLLSSELAHKANALAQYRKRK